MRGFAKKAHAAHINRFSLVNPFHNVPHNSQPLSEGVDSLLCTTTNPYYELLVSESKLETTLRVTIACLGLTPLRLEYSANYFDKTLPDNTYTGHWIAATCLSSHYVQYRTTNEAVIHQANLFSSCTIATKASRSYHVWVG
jgi:hypothetical protein